MRGPYAIVLLALQTLSAAAQSASPPETLEHLTAVCNVQVGQDRVEIGQRQMDIITLKAQLAAAQDALVALQKKFDALEPRPAGAVGPRN